MQIAGKENATEPNGGEEIVHIIVKSGPNSFRQSFCSGLDRALFAFKSRAFWTSFLLGQLCSLFLSGTAVTTTYLVNRGVNIPTTQSSLNYLLLGIVYGIVLACRSSRHDDKLWDALRLRWWKYLLISIVDVEGNFLFVKAYQLTTLFSVQMLDCLIIPVVLILSLIFLKYRYLLLHYVAAFLCIGGALIMVLGDFLTKDVQPGQNRALGDVLVIVGCLFYGISNVCQEHLVRKHSLPEFLFMIGLGGTIVGGIQVIVLEQEDLAKVDWTDLTVYGLLALYALFLFALYSLVPVIMSRSGATVFNLSVLSADFYALLLGVFLFQYQFHYASFLGFVLVIFGLVLYALRSPETGASVNSHTLPDPSEDGDCQEPVSHSIIPVSYRSVSP